MFWILRADSPREIYRMKVVTGKICIAVFVGVGQKHVGKIA
ncbi:conserved protein of unknown function [Xenorhabdus poinarii G6]|uniref:Uncharacterized protein n=1 Tax=Xenorhabdus poinarii G6 TaxID=1354304 RepID=A0A068R669_9GAMM|nr:conserved protein of unknown function [Xenorhabdus poinarii G6]